MLTAQWPQSLLTSSCWLQALGEALKVPAKKIDTGIDVVVSHAQLLVGVLDGVDVHLK